MVETFSRAGGYILGFRVDPDERLEAMFKEAQSFLKVFTANPIFGVDFTVESAEASGAAGSVLPVPKIEEDVDIVEDQEDVHALAAYFVEGNGEGDVQAGDEIGSGQVNVQFDSKLGLAIEGLANDVTIESLWRVV